MQSVLTLVVFAICSEHAGPCFIACCRPTCTTYSVNLNYSTKFNSIYQEVFTHTCNLDECLVQQVVVALEEEMVTIRELFKRTVCFN